MLDQTDQYRETARAACDEINTRLRAEGIPAVVDYAATIGVFARVLAETASVARDETQGLREALAAILDYFRGGITPLDMRELINAGHAALAGTGATACPECEGVKAERDRLAKELARGEKTLEMSRLAAKKNASNWQLMAESACDSRDAALADVERLTKERQRCERFIKGKDWVALNGRRAELIGRKKDLSPFETSELAALNLIVDTLIGIAAPLPEVDLVPVVDRLGGALKRAEAVNAQFVAAWPTRDWPQIIFACPDGTFTIENTKAPVGQQLRRGYPTKSAAVHAAAGVDLPSSAKASSTQAEREPEPNDDFYSIPLGRPDDGQPDCEDPSELEEAKQEAVDLRESLETAERERDAVLEIICRDEDAFWNLLFAASKAVYDEAPDDFDGMTVASRLAWVRRAVGWDAMETKGDTNG